MRVVWWVAALGCTGSTTPKDTADTATPTAQTGGSETGTTTGVTGTTGATGTTGSTADTAPQPLPPPRVLLFTKTAGFRHGSISAAVDALTAEGKVRKWTVTHTEDASTFSEKGLADIDVVVYLLTTGNVLDDAQQGAMEAFIQAGGGFAGVHSATDTEYDWAWYGGLVGAYFDGHPAVQDADVLVDDSKHPATAHLESRFSRRDEWYAFNPNPRNAVNVLLSLDETTYNPGNHDMGGDHPIAWSHEYDGGRAFYTGGGHTSDSYSEPDFLQHLAEGIEWAHGG